MGDQDPKPRVSPKAYISKSNRCEIDKLLFLRKWLKNLGCDVIEHIGGTYDPSLILKADVVYIVSDKGILKGENDHSIHVGKGQFSEADKSLGYGIDVQIIEVDVLASKIYYAEVDDLELYEGDWKTNYGSIGYNSNLTAAHIVRLDSPENGYISEMKKGLLLKKRR